VSDPFVSPHINIFRLILQKIHPVQFEYRLGKERTMNLYVGNLSYEATEEDLQEAFAPFGQVESVTIIRDKFSGQPRGFGFVEMPNNSEALAAISGLAGKEIRGRSVNVNEARPRSDDRRGGGGGRSSGGGGRRSW
jgi:RNA recognition motif-containing protein